MNTCHQPSLTSSLCTLFFNFFYTFSIGSMTLYPDKDEVLSISFTPDFTASVVRRKLFVYIAGSPSPLQCVYLYEYNSFQTNSMVNSWVGNGLYFVNSLFMWRMSCWNFVVKINWSMSNIRKEELENDGCSRYYSQYGRLRAWFSTGRVFLRIAASWVSSALN